MPHSQTLRRLVFNTLRAVFRLMPLPAGTRDRLRQGFLDRHNALVPTGPAGKPARGFVRRPYVHEGAPLLRHVRRAPGALPDPLPATVVAFYLPQFHAIPENDTWWGPGFTEWRNVTRALPQFEGHAQPRLPADLGFYDLSAAGTMAEQIRMAREYGVGAFCTYFYWFAGKTLLETPLRAWLDDRTLDLPIALCWANENWSRRWDGRADDVLIGQAHSADDDLAFIAHVAPYLRDPRYLRVDGRPMLLVYRPGLLPDPAATAKRWRSWCHENGVGDIHLAYVQSFDRVDPASIGFDAAVSFPPNNTSLRPITDTQRLINPAYSGDVFDWRQLAGEAMSATDPAYRLYPAVNPGWDNEARRSGRGRAFLHASPHAFEAWTRHAIATARRRAPSAPLVFVNAWNEWAEGAILEPDARDGFAWLEAIRRALVPSPPHPQRPCAIIHLPHPDTLGTAVEVLGHAGSPFRLVFTASRENEAAVRDALAQHGVVAELIVGPDDGRGILPFLHAACRLREEGESLVLRLHAGHVSQHGDSPGTRRVDHIVSTFAADTALGMVVAPITAPAPGAIPDTVTADLEFLHALAGLGEPDPAGAPGAPGITWCRLDALAPLLDAPLSEGDFVSGSAQAQAAFAEAVERVMPAAAIQAGYTVRSLPDLPDLPGAA